MPHVQRTCVRTKAKGPIVRHAKAEQQRDREHGNRAAVRGSRKTVRNATGTARRSVNVKPARTKEGPSAAQVAEWRRKIRAARDAGKLETLADLVELLVSL